MFIIIVFLLGSDRPSGLLFLSCPLCFYPYSRLTSYHRLLFLDPGEGGWFVIFRIFKYFVYCQLNFIVLFPFRMKYYILFIIIVFWLGCDRPSVHRFFVSPLFFVHTHAPLFTSFVCFFILFHSCCSHAQVFRKTLVHEFHISYSHTEWYLLFSICEGNE